jgi:DNA-binding CsgD family transcriptional regulator
MLELLGLDSEVEAVYRLMLVDHCWGVTELASRLSLHEAVVRSALERLADLKLLHRPQGAEDSLRPVDPKIGLRDLLREHEIELLCKKRDFERCEAELTVLLSEYADLSYHSPQRYAEQLVGIEAVQERIEELAADATSECLTFNPGGAQSPSSLEASRSLDRDVIARGVRMRTVYLDSVRNDLVTTEYAEWLTHLGGEVRTAPSLPLRMLLIDRKTALVPLDPENTRKGAVQLTGSGAVTGLLALFDRVWAAAAPLGTGPARDDRGLTSQEQELLRLLSNGLTDAAAGKRLGVSLRTVRRMMADLMERLEARSRFEAGLRAGQRGWL